MRIVEFMAVAMVAVMSGCGDTEAVATNDPFEGMRWVDLTHPYDKDTVFWPTGQPFDHVHTSWRETEGGYFYSSYDLSVSEHAGTHVDAPIHFSAGGATIDEVSLEDLIGPAVIIDVTQQANANPDYLASAADLAAHEATHGRIPSDAVVAVRTGWSMHWPDVKAYMGDDRPGRTDDLHFPGLGADLAQALASRGIRAVGIDTASIDHGPSRSFEAHQILAGAGVTGLENLTGLEELPERGAWIVAMPMKIGDGSGGPARIAALVRK